MNDLHKYYPKYNPITTPHQTLEQHVKDALIDELCNKSTYTVPGLSDFIQSCTHQYTLSMPSITFHVVESPNIQVDHQQLQKVCKRIQCILSAFGDERHITFCLIPFPSKRHFPVDEEFHPTHINGAYTYPNLRKVYIYRFEDYAKVALHETCHNLPIHCHSWDDNALKRLYDYFNIDYTGCPHNCVTNILPNEAVVEVWAEVLHGKLLSYEYGIPYEKLHKVECHYAIQKTLQILHYQRTKYPLWREKTHAFSYVVIRLVLLWFWKEFSMLKFPYDTTQLTDFIIAYHARLPLRDFKRSLTKTMSMTKTGNF